MTNEQELERRRIGTAAYFEVILSSDPKAIIYPVRKGLVETPEETITELLEKEGHSRYPGMNDREDFLRSVFVEVIDRTQAKVDKRVDELQSELQSLAVRTSELQAIRANFVKEGE
jgi:hypothetical protein